MSLKSQKILVLNIAYERFFGVKDRRNILPFSFLRKFFVLSDLKNKICFFDLIFVRLFNFLHILKMFLKQFFLATKTAKIAASWETRLTWWRQHCRIGFASPHDRNRRGPDSTRSTDPILKYKSIKDGACLEMWNMLDVFIIDVENVSSTYFLPARSKAEL